jgi:hypothetical protein
MYYINFRKFDELEAQGYETCLLKKIHLNVMIL